MSALLPTRIVEKPWGRSDLPAPFAPSGGRRVGEIWFEPPPELDSLLVKYLFTSEKLSVQVHPPGAQGKDECWLVLDTQPGASLGIGFRDDISPAEMRAAALDGSIEEMMVWHPVEPGDFVYIPAGTVHAIGAGVCLVELQQNNDATYRLYDYGRPRELHLDYAIAVAHGGPHNPAMRRKLPPKGSATLTTGPYFTLERAQGRLGDDHLTRKGPLLVVPIDGDVLVAGENVSPGECAVASGPDAVSPADDAQCLLAWPGVTGA